MLTTSYRFNWLSSCSSFTGHYPIIFETGGTYTHWQSSPPLRRFSKKRTWRLPKISWCFKENWIRIPSKSNYSKWGNSSERERTFFFYTNSSNKSDTRRNPPSLKTTANEYHSNTIFLCWESKFKFKFLIHGIIWFQLNGIQQIFWILSSTV